MSENTTPDVELTVTQLDALKAHFDSFEMGYTVVQGKDAEEWIIAWAAVNPADLTGKVHTILQLSGDMLHTTSERNMASYYLFDEQGKFLDHQIDYAYPFH